LDFSRPTVTLLPKTPALLLTLIVFLRYSSKAAVSKTLSSTGCQQSTVNFAVDFFAAFLVFFYIEGERTEEKQSMLDRAHKIVKQHNAMVEEKV
jgi:hypothetical protein